MKSCFAAFVPLVVVLSGCATHAGRTEPGWPYPRSTLIGGVDWDFSQMQSQRRAHGSDLWPCTWASDDRLYCSFGDGGGFDGDSDWLGRVSLGFARITGVPTTGDPGAFSGRNVWGDAPEFAEHRASFGGKVSSMISIDGTLYAYGGLWTAQTTRDPVHKGSDGPVKRLIWSTDLGATWQLAAWDNTRESSFLNFGRDRAGPDSRVYIYFQRPGDDSNAYLARVPKERLMEDPALSGAYEYLAGTDGHGTPGGWSHSETDAKPVFTDPKGAAVQVIYDAPLRRYLLTSGHDLQNASAGQVGLFEAPEPWGPWHTVGYYADWGALGPESHGDYLGITFPLPWISHDGLTLWGIFSSLGQYDSFNIVRATLHAGRAAATH